MEQDNRMNLNRRRIIEELAEYDINQEQIYLIDIIPLIEMIWADNKAQKGEIVLLDSFLKKHVEHINQLAGYGLLSFEKARDFALRFLKTRPDPKLLSLLRSYVEPVRFAVSAPDQRDLFRNSLLAACIDIAASSVVKYPYALNERFNSEEKKCFFEILDAFK